MPVPLKHPSRAGFVEYRTPEGSSKNFDEDEEKGRNLGCLVNEMDSSLS